MHSVTGKTRDRPWLLGPRLKQAREKARLSLREASRAAGFSAATWALLEKGVKHVAVGVTVPANPRAEIVIAAAQVVGMEPAEALKLANLDPALAPANRYGGPTVSQREAMMLWAQLDEDTRGLLLDLLRKLVGPEAASKVDIDATVLPAVGDVAVFDVKRASSKDS